MPQHTQTLSPDLEAFFDYRCDTCGTVMCERETLFALSLGHEEGTLCVHCLSREEEIPLETLLQQCKRYMQARDCFRKPWNNAEAQAACCPLKASHACVCT